MTVYGYIRVSTREQNEDRQLTGVFGCGVTAAGKNGTFDVLKLTLKAKETGIGKNVIDVTVGNMSKVDGSTMMDFGTVDSFEVTTESEMPTTYTVTLVQSGLIGATAELSKTENIVADDTVTVTITPESGKFFESVPVVTTDGATAGTVTKSGENYTCTISAFTANSTVTVTGEAVIPTHICVYDQEVVKDEALKTAADCENAAVYYKSCTCGKVSSNDADIFTSGDSLGHTESAWKTSETEHWKVCTVASCGKEIKDSRGAHEDNDGNNKCDSCEYDMTPAHTCVFDQEVVKEEALKTVADCENAAVYYKSCTCGIVSSNNADTFTSGSPLGHTPSAWKTSSTEHWKTCTVASCGKEIVNSRGAHADNDGNNKCDSCEYDMTPAHTCVFNQEIVKDEALKTAADCENAAVYYKSCTCGIISSNDADTFTSGNPLGHTPSAWKTSSTEHWKTCTVANCGKEIKDSRGTHTDNDGNNKCDTCEYDMTPAHTCVFDQEVVKDEALKTAADCENVAVYYTSCTCGIVSSNEADTFTSGDPLGHTESAWKTNEEEHWKTCTVASCGKEIANSRGAHADNDGNNKCDSCEYDMTPVHICVFDQETVKEEALKTAADCENAAVYYKSCTCGIVSSNDADTFTSGSPLGHTPSAWKISTTEHWKTCTVASCGKEIANSRGAHADTNSDSKCDACEYDMTPVPEHTHTFSNEWSKNDT